MDARQFYAQHNISIGKLDLVSGKTVQEVVNSMNDEQKTAMYALIGAALDSNMNKGGEQNSPSTSDWATKEVELAIQTEKECSAGTDDWQDGAECYRSALQAFHCFPNDDKSGVKNQITKSILNRLIDGRCLTPVDDTPDIWTDISEVFSKGSKSKHYQCKRMSSLFKEVTEDGTVILSDTNRVCGVNVNNPNVAFTSGFLTHLIDAIVPITFPYLPSGKKFKVVVDEFLVDPKNGDYDTIAYLYFTTPHGKKVELNRYFKEVDGHMVQIEKAEFDERKAKRVDMKGETHG